MSHKKLYKENDILINDPYLLKFKIKYKYMKEHDYLIDKFYSLLNKDSKYDLVDNIIRLYISNEEYIDSNLEYKINNISNLDIKYKKYIEEIMNYNKKILDSYESL